MNRYTLCGILAIVFWSTTVAFARSLSEKIGSITGATAVFLFSGIFCLTWMFLSKRSFWEIRNQSRKYLFGCGSLFVFYMLCLFLAIGISLNRSQVLEIGLINYLWPALTILFSVILLKKRSRGLLLPATGVALVGTFLVTTQGSSISWSSFKENIGSNPGAYALALSAALSWALYSVLTRRWARPESGGAVQWFVPVTGVVLLGLRALYPEEASWSVSAFLEILFMSMATTFGYVFWDLAMRKGDVVLVATLSYFTPLLSTLISCIYLGVRANMQLWVGCFLIMAGSIVTRFSVSD